ncbi:MAG TPA: hypothetical protein VD788_06325, partial [Candidatus Polarisedimenticolaceae bacterium]|nr:hypothetical protein [Candidatus Polarisedimenticolaceae bacterium]
ANPDPAGGDAPPAGAPGRVVLDLRHADFDLRAAGEGEGLGVRASYDEQSYTLLERFEPAAGAEWEYRVEFRRTGLGLLTGLKELLGGTRPKVEVRLPADRPLALDVDVQQSALTADLGGLWLTRAGVRVKQGAIDLDVSTPLRAPIDELSFNVSMGGVVLESLGNASPESLIVELHMGGGDIDLRGRWVNDAHVRIDTSMGGAQLRLPRDVSITGLERGLSRVEPDAEIARPTLQIEIDPADLETIEIID